MREKYKKELLEHIKNGEDANFELADGTPVTFFFTGKTFEEALEKQFYSYLRDTKQQGADKKEKEKIKNDLREAMNPYEHLGGSEKYQFLDIRGTEYLSEEEIEELFTNTDFKLDEYASSFKSASEDNDISVVYLVGHACLETGYGAYAKVSKGDTPPQYYNMYGYGGYDSNPSEGLLEAAIANDWTSKEKAITGGAEKIENYNIKEQHQFTCYDMRYNPKNPGENQYATDMKWPVKQVEESNITQFYDNLPPKEKHYYIPVYYEIEATEE